MAQQVQLDFLDRHLRGTDAPVLPRVRLEVRECRDHIVEVREESDWPLPSTRWTPLYRTGTGLADQLATEPGSITFDTTSSGASLGWRVPADTELIGPMALRLFVEMTGAEDVDLVVGVEKWRKKKYVPFEGS